MFRHRLAILPENGTATGAYPSAGLRLAFEGSQSAN